MDFMRRTASGRLSEVMGESTLSLDRFFRTLGFRQLAERSEEHTSELQSLMRISYAVFCLQTKNTPMTVALPKTALLRRTERHKPYIQTPIRIPLSPYI